MFKERKDMKLKRKQTNKFEINSYIDQDLKSSFDPIKPNVLNISAVVHSKKQEQFKVNVYFWAFPILEGDVFIQIFSKKKLEIGLLNKTEEIINFQMDLNDIPLKTFRKEASKSTPVLIEIINAYVKSIYEYNMNSKEMFKPVLISKGVVINNKFTFVEAVFGLKNSKFGDTKEKETCIICMDNDRDTLIEPCKHMCLCAECAQALKENTNLCPMCRNKIINFSQIIVK